MLCRLSRKYRCCIVPYRADKHLFPRKSLVDWSLVAYHGRGSNPPQPHDKFYHRTQHNLLHMPYKLNSYWRTLWGSYWDIYHLVTGLSQQSKMCRLWQTDILCSLFGTEHMCCSNWNNLPDRCRDTFLKTGSFPEHSSNNCHDSYRLCTLLCISCIPSGTGRFLLST